MEIAFGKVRVDCKALRGKRGKEAIELTPREMKVLAVLFRERGNAVSREALLNEGWGVDYYGTTRTSRSIDREAPAKNRRRSGRAAPSAHRAHARLSAGNLSGRLVFGD